MRRPFGGDNMRYLGLDVGKKYVQACLLNDNLSIIEYMNSLIKDVDKKVCELARFDDDIRLMLNMKGIDVYTALLIKSEIVDIKKFKTYKNLVSYAGLAPSLHQSGSVSYSGRITKQGRKLLRWALVEAAWSAVAHDDHLRSFYDRICRRKGSGKAIVATAAKMLKIIWFMLVRREVYHGFDAENYGKKLSKISK